MNLSTLVLFSSVIVLATAVCRDHPSCAGYHGNEAYYCRFDWTKRNCKSLCHLCDKESSIDCVDNSRCQIYSGNKNYYCQHDWLKVNCKKMCEICKPNGNKGCGFDHVGCLSYKGYEEYYCKYDWTKQHCKNMCGQCRVPTTVMTTTPGRTPEPTTDSGSGGGSLNDHFIYA